MSPKNNRRQKYRLRVLMCCLVMTTVSSICSANKCLKNDLYPHPTDCTRFYSCAPGRPILMRCPAGLHFNAQLLACDWPETSGCVSSEPELKHNMEEEDCPIHPDPTDCTKFYLCSPSGRFAIDCPPTLRFNPRVLVCDWPEHTECFDETSMVSDAEVSTVSLFDEQATSTVVDVETTTYQGSESTAWSEIDLSMITTPISEELLIEASTSSTETAVDEVTTDSWISYSTFLRNITTAEQLPSMCAGGIRLHESDCKKFYMSSPAGILTLSCPGETLFNPETLLCDLATNVVCSEKVIATTTVEDDDDTNEVDTENTTELNDSPLCKSSMWPHPTDCATYFMCSPTGPIEMFCSDELLFNPTLLVCDWPGNFECFKNISPEISTVAGLTD